MFHKNEGKNTTFCLFRPVYAYAANDILASDISLPMTELTLDFIHKQY